MRARRRVIGAGLAAALALAVSPAASAPDASVKRDIAYGALPEQTLTACLPSGGGHKPRAGVVLIHGGGWFGGDKNELVPLCKTLARDGLFAATIDYRLVVKDRPDTLWPAQLADVQLAVRWLRANAGPLGFDAGRLCAYGESAGGHLAVFLAAKPTIEPSDMAALLPTQPVSVICAVDNFGPVDLLDPGPLKVYVEHLLGRELQTSDMAAFREASPLFLVGPGTAPVFIEQGTADTVVAPGQSLKLFDTLTANGVTARLVTFAGGHSWIKVSASERKLMADEERQFLRLFLTRTPRRG